MPSVADDARRYVQRALSPTSPAQVEPYRTLGLATSEQVAKIKRVTGADVSGFDFALDQSAVLHIRNEHGNAAAEATRGQQPIEPSDYGLLPQIANAPDAILAAGTSGVGRRVVRLMKTLNGVRFVAKFEIRTGRRMLALQSFWKGKP